MSLEPKCQCVEWTREGCSGCCGGQDVHIHDDESGDGGQDVHIHGADSVKFYFNPHDKSLVNTPSASTGPAECNVIKAGGKVIMIDVGGWNRLNSIRSYLSEIGVTKVDALIISHWHGDHCANIQAEDRLPDIDWSECVAYLPGEVPAIVENNNPTKYADLLARRSACEEFCALNCESVVHPDEGDTITIGGIKLTFLNCGATAYGEIQALQAANASLFDPGFDFEDVSSDPDDNAGESVSGEDHDDMEGGSTVYPYNDYSMVVRVDVGNNRVLYPGDIQYAGQLRLCQKNLVGPVTLLKFQHHNSNSCHSWSIAYYPRFAKVVRPQFITVQRGATYSPSAQRECALYEHSVIFCPLFKPTVFEARFDSLLPVQYDYTYDAPSAMMLDGGISRVVPGSDLNDYVRPGSYTIMGYSHANQIANVPQKDKTVSYWIVNGQETLENPNGDTPSDDPGYIQPAGTRVIQVANIYNSKLYVMAGGTNNAVMQLLYGVGGGKSTAGRMFVRAGIVTKHYAKDAEGHNITDPEAPGYEEPFAARDWYPWRQIQTTTDGHFLGMLFFDRVIKRTFNQERSLISGRDDGIVLGHGDKPENYGAFTPAELEAYEASAYAQMAADHNGLVDVIRDANDKRICGIEGMIRKNGRTYIRLFTKSFNDPTAADAILMLVNDAPAGVRYATAPTTNDAVTSTPNVIVTRDYLRNQRFAQVWDTAHALSYTLAEALTTSASMPYEPVIPEGVTDLKINILCAGAQAAGNLTVVVTYSDGETVSITITGALNANYPAEILVRNNHGVSDVSVRKRASVVAYQQYPALSEKIIGTATIISVGLYSGEAFAAGMTTTICKLTSI